MNEKLDKDIPFAISRVDNQREAFAALTDFIQSQKGAHPELRYPEDEINRMNPEDRIFSKLITYEARRGDHVSGVLTGQDKKDGLFLGQFLIVEPESQHSKAAMELMRAVQRDFSEIQLRAASFAEKNDAPDAKYVARQNALFRVYEKMGFQSALTGMEYEHAKRIGAPIRMVWRTPNKTSI